MIKNDKDQCCGCFACVSYCPKKAIRIENDIKMGFFYPHIDADLCVGCDLCDEICDFKRTKKIESNILCSYGLQHKNIDTLKNSTSGGAFTAFSDLFLKKNGAVVGAIMENFHIFHKIAETTEDRDAMRGSKYVQSDMRGIYEKIEARLKVRQQLMFIGTPCQTAAIKSYFGDRYKGQLYLFDFLCHGVPSEKMFREHIAFISTKSRKKCVDYKFRGKEFGWRSHVMEGALFERKKNYQFKSYMQNYASLFYSGASLRPSCHKCKYRSYFRYSDITIADFWGIERIAPDQNNGLGHSLILVNSEEGVDLINKLILSETVKIFNVPKSDIMFRIALKPAPNIEDHDMFWDIYSQKGYLSVMNNYCATSIQQKIRFGLKKFLMKKG